MDSATAFTPQAMPSAVPILDTAKCAMGIRAHIWITEVTAEWFNHNTMEGGAVTLSLNVITCDLEGARRKSIKIAMDHELCRHAHTVSVKRIQFGNCAKPSDQESIRVIEQITH